MAAPTARGLQVLYAVHEIQHETSEVVTGPQLLARFQKSTISDETRCSVEGLHQSAATLVRHGLLRKFYSRPMTYEITDAGREALVKAIDEKGRPL